MPSSRDDTCRERTGSDQIAMQDGAVQQVWHDCCLHADHVGFTSYNGRGTVDTAAKQAHAELTIWRPVAWAALVLQYCKVGSCYRRSNGH